MSVRTTIELSDETAELLERESARLGLPAAQIVCEALERRLATSRATERTLPFESLGVSGDPLLSQRIDEILAAEWGHGDPHDR